jgi:hypothetical protein
VEAARAASDVLLLGTPSSSSASTPQATPRAWQQHWCSQEHQESQQQQGRCLPEQQAGSTGMRRRPGESAVVAGVATEQQHIHQLFEEAHAALDAALHLARASLLLANKV